MPLQIGSPAAVFTLALTLSSYCETIVQCTRIMRFVRRSAIIVHPN